jgi:sensor domain CHASE-containing protein
MSHMKNRLQAQLIGSIFLFIITISSYLVIAHINDKWQQERQLDLKQIIQTQVFALEKSVKRRISSAKILAAWVRSNDGKVDNFARFSEEIIEAVGGITNLQLAPDGIVQYIFPLTGHEQALGHNILEDDTRLTEARLALLSNQLTLAGPFKLKQGGAAIVGRQPIFLTNSDNSTHDSKPLITSFWGFASTLIYIEELIANTSLDQLYQQGFYFKLWRNHPDSGVKEVIYQNTSKDILPQLDATVALPNAIWHLSIEEVQAQHQKFDITPIIIIVVLFDLLLSFFMYRYLLKKYRIQAV